MLVHYTNSNNATQGLLIRLYCLIVKFHVPCFSNIRSGKNTHRRTYVAYIHTPRGNNAVFFISHILVHSYVYSRNLIRKIYIFYKISPK
jgi:hypothetical protein